MIGASLKESLRSTFPTTLRRSLVVFLALAGVAWLAACGGTGGGGSPPPPPPQISVTVSPGSVASLLLGRAQSFTATVTGTSNTAVTWSISGTGCSGAACGAIDNAGNYTAPNILPNPSTIAIRATSAASSSSFGTASVTITSDVTVSVSPGNPSVELGAVQPFGALVQSPGGGSPNPSVTWSLSGASCTGAACGTINSTTGQYTAPQFLPTPTPTVTVVATSVADPSKSNSTSLTLTANFTLAVNGPGSVDNSTSAQFNSTLTPVPGSNPSPSVSWNVGGPCAASPQGCGLITQSGLYTAPDIAPAGPNNFVVVTATSLADPTKSANTPNVTIVAIVVVTVSPRPASVELETSQQFTAVVGGAANTAVIWDVNGIVGGNQNTVGAITNGGNYFAPISMPAGATTVTITATSVADPTKADTVTVTLFSTIAIVVTPSSSIRALNRRQPLNVGITRTGGSTPANAAMEFRVNNISGGNITVGQICLRAPDGTPCQPSSVSGPLTLLDYLAPSGTVPAPNPVTIEVISQADTSRVGTAQVNIVQNISVSISPANATLQPNQQQQLTASVAGTSNQLVTWKVNNTVGGDATFGWICAFNQQTCHPSTGPMDPGPFPITGATDQPVYYVAPPTPPNPAQVSITADSFDDPLQSGGGSFTINPLSPVIRHLLPASITAIPASPNAQPFILKVRGDSLSAIVPISILRVNSVAQTTSCTDLGAGSSPRFECMATLDPNQANSPLNAPGNISIQVENLAGSAVPGLSNQVNMVVVAEATSEAVISLTAGVPAAFNQDITVVEPTTAGTNPTNQANITHIAILVGQSCPVTTSPSPISITRPASGSTDIELCAFNSSNFPVGSLLSLSGPNPNDITIVSGGTTTQSSVLARFTVRIPSTARTGPRTLFVESPNKEKSALTGAIEIK